ncbi:MAG TPA: hypothetical protein ENJ18_19460 [Nannocystis exedens]|nr:hypothetical protein [Nannocystis exedens]
MHPLQSNQRRSILPLALLVLSWSGTSGCALEQRMAVEVIDAPLRETGQELQASRSPSDELRLGSYTITSIQRQHTRDGTPLLPDLKPRPSTFYHLSFELQRSDAQHATTSFWVNCVAERRVAQNSDFAAAADESHDEVALTCTLHNKNTNTWTLSAQGDVNRGLSGSVGHVGGAKSEHPAEEPPLSTPSRSAFEVEVLARRRFFGAVARELPFPVAQLRREHHASAAMLLDTPERAWLAKGLSHDDRELALATMVALRLLPLGEGPIGR